ncbi:MAG: alpha/beta hydrolase, partial [Bacteroidales bacterium]|nr:alpha/beta hydrolase [Bacteroidales bacterium]
FLTNCKDDPIVDWRNSEVMDSALTAKGIPHMYMQYGKGGHGYGVSSSVNPEPSSGWVDIWQEFHMKK